MGRTKAEEVESPSICRYVPAAGADGIVGDGRRGPAVVNGACALGTPRRWVGVCESFGLRILNSIMKEPRGKEKDRSQFSQAVLSCLPWWKGELLACSGSLLQQQILFMFSSRPCRKWSRAHTNNYLVSRPTVGVEKVCSVRKRPSGSKQYIMRASTSNPDSSLDLDFLKGCISVSVQDTSFPKVLSISIQL